ncbi:15702_t:CDS:2 [Cetraspora pellucida]|uniref:15702_t:CDS:1 n=1 Tax=Cetraspora pellucida TaxID=1433469 RepID=A0A9N8VRR0_9GLOM|nr:15702_t:CDS:2 [Cetraspora pellucida]
MKLDGFVAGHDVQTNTVQNNMSSFISEFRMSRIFSFISSVHIAVSKKKISNALIISRKACTRIFL